MATDFTTTETFTIEYKDAGGNTVTPAAGQVVVSDSDPTVATVAPSADGTSGTLTAVKVGPVSLVATRSDGVAIPLTNGDFTVVAGQPVSGTVTPGTPAP
jgi:uncharacterized protein YjdB